MFPLLTVLRKKLRLLLKHRAAWPLPQQFVTTFYKQRKEENREELRDQLLESLFYLRANMRFCHNIASFRIFDLCEETWTYRCYICHQNENLKNDALQLVIKQRLFEFMRLLNAELPVSQRRCN